MSRRVVILLLVFALFAVAACEQTTDAERFADAVKEGMETNMRETLVEVEGKKIRVKTPKGLEVNEEVINEILTPDVVEWLNEK